MFWSEKNAYINDLNALRILMNFLCIYLCEKGGWTNACICMGKHIVGLYYRNRSMDINETW